MTRDLPSHYLFQLVCCFKSSRSHPLCKADTQQLPKWFSSGPFVSYLPLPVPDPAKPWGSKDCSTCNGLCCGHFMKPEVAMLSPLEPMKQPPSVVIREVFKRIKGSPTDIQIQETAKKVLCPLMMSGYGLNICRQLEKIEGEELKRQLLHGEERR